ncbi:MAG: PAS domain S-box protein [Promethearchaeota archaeon]|jgi:PAS domain S-box-containing protein
MASTDKDINKINQLISENIEDLIFICNENNECEYHNFKELNYRMHLVDILHPSDSKRLVKFVENVFRFGFSRDEFEIIGNNNLAIWYDIKGKTFVDDQNDKKVILICRDISNFKRLEKEINVSQTRYTQLADTLPEIKYWKLLQSKESITAIQKTREMLEVVINNIPQLIYWKDKELVYLGCNANFAALNGLANPHSIIGRTDDDLKWLFQKSENIKESEYDVLKNDKPDYHITELLITSDGNQGWYEINRVPLHDLGGDVVGILVTYEDITIRKFSEQKLKESEERYRNLVFNLTDIILEVDLEGTVTYVSPQSYGILGYYPTEIIGKNAFQFIHPEDVPKTAETLKKGIQTKEMVSVSNYRLLCKNGDVRVVSARGKYVKTNGNERIISAIRDITEKKIAEQRLKKSQEDLQILNRELEEKVQERTKDLIESERQYRATIDSLGDPLHVVDKDLNIILINKAFKQWLSELNINTEIIGKRVPEVFPFLISNIYDEYEEVFDTGSHLVTIETNTVQERDVITETRKIPIFSEGRVEQVITIIRDITDSREMENQLKKSEEKYRNMVNYLDVGFYKGEYRGKLLMHNQAFNEMLGLGPNESVVGSESSKFFVNPEIQKKYYSELDEKGLVKNFVAQIKNFKGEIIAVDLNAHVIYDSEGKPIEIEGTFADITEKFKLQQELLESEKKLREKNIELMKLDEIKNDFITMAAHELKTPLISISGYTDYILMKHRNLLTAEITEDLKTVQRNVTRLEVLMDQLLEVMKIDENKLKLQKERVNVSKIINDCLDELSYLINEKNLEVILNINHEIVLSVDPNRIFTVFTNLISNAIKFTPVYGWIEISGKKIEDKYLFEVKDNGIGLAEEDISRLFKKFERIQQPIVNENLDIKDSGTGLGLYITKSYINAHSGEIRAISEGLNKGTKFEFTLPI